MKKNRCLRVVVPKARGLREGWGGRSGLSDVSSYIQSG